MNERELVARARELFSERIGDDGAVVDGQVFTADMLVEDVDFTRATPLRSIARKALAVNLSDLAAMGASPAYALLSLALPPWVAAEELLAFFADAAKRYSIEIIGGDFSRAEKLTIAITAIGRVVTRPLLRSGAKVGDRVYLSRPVGAAGAGLQLMPLTLTLSPQGGERGLGFAEREFVESVIRRQLEPEPEIALGIALARIEQVTACIDVSDGLSTDLHHLCDASQCGAEIERERIPIFPDLLTFGPRLGIRVSDVVLHGGEEYALLFTSSLRESELSQMLGRPVYAIGRITSAREIVLKEDGVPRPLESRGFDHFG
ncbi:MAG TPA: thiamine-phosphate kinase [Thermoanaerobaculia bacterium]|nr:thiamine-phosphate kinase [Thermoanaerobaculia bacterium]